MPTRRQLLQGLAGAAAFGASGCRTPAPPSARAVVGPSLAASPSAVALVRPSAFPTLAAAVREVIARAGGLPFVREGDRVLLKPATNSPRPYPATADPEVVLEVARMVIEAGGVPFIADRTVFSGSTAITFHKLGYFEAAHQARISCQALDSAAVVAVNHERATSWGGVVPIYRPVFEADHVINLCTPRTHRIGDFTMAMKNWVGVVDAGARLGMHLPGGFKQRVAEISLVVRPALVLMDGRQGFTNGGPDSGDLARLDFLAAAVDPVAIDAVGLAQLRLAGANERISSGSIWKLPVMKRAVELGLGATTPAGIVLSGLTPPKKRRCALSWPER